MAKVLQRVLGRRPSGLSPWETRRTERRLASIVILYLVVIVGIVGFNAREMSREQGAALSLNVAARQRALAERYVRDVVLDGQGVHADPVDDARQLLTNADALLSGGEVIAVQGADNVVRIRPASDDPRPEVGVVLADNRRLDLLGHGLRRRLLIRRLDLDFGGLELVEFDVVEILIGHLNRVDLRERYRPRHRP